MFTRLFVFVSYTIIGKYNRIQNPNSTRVVREKTI